MNAQSKRALLASLILIFSSLAGCLGNDLEEIEEFVDGETQPYGTVMVSTYHVGELVKAIAGDDITLDYMSQDNIPVHDYEPSASDLLRLQEADVFFYHGLGLEPWVEATLDSLGTDAPTAIEVHTMPEGQATLDYESLLVDNLCRLLAEPATTDVHVLSDDDHDLDVEIHTDDESVNLAFPEHEDESHHDESHEEEAHDDEGHDDEGHSEEGHEGHGHAEAEETIENPDSCASPTVISIYHLEAGEHVLEFEAEDVESFRMAIAAMGGAHHHHHDHGDHGDEHGVCHDMTTHENHAEYEDEDACEAAGYMWMEEEHDGDHEGVCHDATTHENHAEFEDEDACEAAGHVWMEGDHDDDITAEEGMEMYDTNNDSYLSFEEVTAAMESMEDDEEGHHHGNETSDSNETSSGNETEDDDHHDEHEHALETALNQHLFDEADTDNNSLLNVSELETFIEMLDHADDHMNADMMVDIYLSVFDENDDGQLSHDEFAEMAEAMEDEDGHDEHHHSNETSSNETSDDDHDAMIEMMFAMYDANNDSSINATELHAMMNMMMEEDHHEAAYATLHVEEEGDYGIALPPGVNLHILMGDEHEGHGHDDGHDGHGGEDAHDEDEEGHDDEDGHDEHGDEDALDYDPHSWLSPIAYSAQLDIVLDAMKTAFPDGAASFQTNADAYNTQLVDLDLAFIAAFGAGGSCDEKGAEKTVVANHNAYSYLAVRYDIEFKTVHGLDPEGEPSPEDLAEVVEQIEDKGLTVLYVEEYTDLASIQSIVDETGVTIQTLYTMEMAPSDAGDDYLSMMNKNLDALVAGIGC